MHYMKLSFIESDLDPVYTEYALACSENKYNEPYKSSTRKQ